ncbi:hypothetical protein HDV00_003701 [Rhizophlyctis rosea]|nr:hypothetical protein HDV00_003701 [Rhizophlyctis rosea]
MTETGTSVAPTYSTAKVSQHLLAITPPEFRFTDSRLSVGYISRLTLTNRNNKPVGFKFKTNAPARYSVKPVLGTLEPNASVDVFVRSETQINLTDRFLLQTLILSNEEASAVNATMWKQLDKRRMADTFIDCRLRDGAGAGKLGSSPSQSQLDASIHRSTSQTFSVTPKSSSPSTTASHKARALTHTVTAMTTARYTKLQTILISAVCLVLGILVPYRWLLHQLTSVVVSPMSA